MVSYFINRPNDFVLESIEGAVASVPYLRRLDGFPEVTSWVSLLSIRLHYHTHAHKSGLQLPHVGEGRFRWGSRQK